MEADEKDSHRLVPTFGRQYSSMEKRDYKFTILCKRKEKIKLKR